MKTSINIETTNVCNARCITCPRPERQGYMTRDNLDVLMERLYESSDSITIPILSGFGETILYPDFLSLMSKVRAVNHGLYRAGKKQLPFATVTNGQALTPEKLSAIDETIERLSISFASADKEKYEKIHVGLDYDRVIKNIGLAIEKLKKTRLVLHLTPTIYTDEKDIESTVDYWRNRGVKEFVLFPMTSNRAGSLKEDCFRKPNPDANIALARRLGIKHLESVFRPGILDFAQILRRRLSEPSYCIPGIASLSIDYNGNYRYCINDLNSTHVIGNIRDLSIKDALERRIEMTSSPICAGCNINGHFSLKTLTRTWMNSLLTGKFKSG